MRCKKVSACLASVLFMVMCLLSGATDAYAEEANATLLWEYETYGDGVAVTKYNGTATDVYVPATLTIEGEDGEAKQVQVLKLGDNLFAGNAAINSVTLANGIVEIGEKTFYDADNLVCIVAGETVTTIGAEAFKSCDNFNSVILYDAVESIGKDAFAECPKVTVWCNSGSAAYEHVIENGITYQLLNPEATQPETFVVDGLTYYIMNGQAVAIDCDDALTEVIVPLTMQGYPVVLQETFRDCTNLISVTLPDGITELGDNLFYNCQGLTTVNIPEGVTRIGQSSFYNCMKLSEIELPNSVSEFGSGAFNFTGIREIKIPDGVITLPEYLFAYSSALEKVIIPKTVEEIEGCCFLGCTNLSTVILEEGIETIGYSAFKECNALTKFRIPRSVASIGENAFPYNMVYMVYEESYGYEFAKEDFLYLLCNGETEPEIVTVKEGFLTYYIINGKAVAVDCEDTATEVTVPEMVNECPVVLRATFQNCSNLVSVILPETITELGDYLFESCQGLTTVNIPEGVTRIGHEAFARCWSMEKIEIPESVTVLGNMAFSGTGIKEIELPEGITELSPYLFAGTNLEKITIPGTIEEIPERCFEGCAKLTTVVLEEGVKTIAPGVFAAGCDSLKWLVIPKSMEVMEPDAFPSAIVFGVYEGCYGQSFADENSFLYVIYDGETEPEILKENGLTYCIMGGKAMAIDCDDTITEVEVPETVNGCPVELKATFKECRNLVSVTLPDTITEIGDYLFYCCHSLTSVNIPENVTRIGHYAFDYCNSLTSLELPDGITEIGENAFRNIALDTMEFPERVTSLSHAMFSYAGLEKITVPKTVEVIGSHCFSYCSKLETVVLEEGIQKIAGCAFMDTAVKTVVIPQSVTELGDDLYGRTIFPANTILVVYEDTVAHTYAKENNLLYFVLKKTENPEIAYGASITGTAAYLDGTAASGATVEILYDDGTVKESKTTDAGGNYEFTYAEVGTYTIRVTDGNGNSASENIAVTRMNAFDVFVMGDTNLKLKKGYSVSGTYAAGSATVSLTDTEGNVIMSTAETGSFSFSNVQNGTYIITVNGSNFRGSAEVTVYGNDVIGIEVMVVSDAAAISGNVYVADRSNNKILRNWVQVTLYNEEGVAVAQCKSDTVGRYEFTNVAAGAYTVVAEATEMRPDKNKNYDRNHKLTGYAYVDVTGSGTYTVDITLYEESNSAVTISGKVTAQGETQNCEVILKNVFHAEIAKCTTGKNGKYSFLNVKDGLYFIFATTESDGMGMTMVSVVDGEVSGEKDITVYKSSKITEMEQAFISDMQNCTGKDGVEAYRKRVAAEKKLYDSLSEKEKKQLSKGYVDRLNEMVEWLSGCTFTADSGVTVEQAGLVVSGEELEKNTSVSYEIDVTNRGAVSNKTNGEVKTKEDYIQHSIEDTADNTAGDAEIVGYYDIEMKKNGQKITDVSKDADTTGKFRITMEIPENEKGKKHYSMVHEHNGKTEVLTDLDDNPDTITIEVDSFSTFALIATKDALFEVEEDEEVTDVPELKFYGASLYLQDNISVNYKIEGQKYIDAGYEELYVKFEFNGKETIITEYTIEDNGLYSFEFSDVAPQWLNDTIYATLYAKLNGEIMESAVQEYSVANYCYNQVKKETTSEQVKNLMVDLLNYGAAAQIYAKYKPDDLVNSALTEEQKQFASDMPENLTSVKNTEYVVIDNPTVSWYGARLRLEDSVTICYTIQADNAEELSMKVEADGNTWIIPGTSFIENNGMYDAYFDGLNAAQMSVPVYTTIYNGSTVVSNTLCYSIESYVKAKQDDSDTDLVNMLNEMIKYGYAAHEYAK